jgi:hypothetical protein
MISPRDAAQLVQIIAHHHICLFDNISILPGWMSDILAQACTGGGFSKRQLYTDDDDIIYRVKRCIGLNGINLMISKPDLMDRSILLNLDRIDPTRRIEEAVLWQKFEEERPHILGGIFDILAKAVAIYPEVKPVCLHRMADFTRWGFAVAEALGGLGEKFLIAYGGNIESQNEEVVQGNTLAQAVLTFMDDKGKWEGYIKEAFTKFQEIANPSKYDKTFPGDAKNLRRHLERIKTTLSEYGISFTIGKRSGPGIPISFLRDCKKSTASASSTQSADNSPKPQAEAESSTPSTLSGSSTAETQSSTQSSLSKTFKNADGVDDVVGFHTYREAEKADVHLREGEI